jgi:hypothetical protein
MPRVNYELPSAPKRQVVAGKRVSPLGTQARDAQAIAQAKAMDKLIAEREAYMKSHNGNYPSDAQLEASRKNR